MESGKLYKVKHWVYGLRNNSIPLYIYKNEVFLLLSYSLFKDKESQITTLLLKCIYTDTLIQIPIDSKIINQNPKLTFNEWFEQIT